MIATKAPIGEIINYIHKNSDSYLENGLLKKIEALIDLIIIRTDKKGIDEALNSLQDNIFELKFEIINNTKLVRDTFKDLNDTIENRIKKQFNKTTKHKYLEQAYVNAINIYGQIAEAIIEKVSNTPFVAINNLPSYKYDHIVTFLKSLPGKESQFILSYIKSSIDLDYAFIVSELIFNNELKIKNAEIDNLCLLLKNSIEEFAVYSKAFNLWSPSDSDESQWIRNIKIRISAFESTLPSKNHSSEEIKNILSV